MNVVWISVVGSKKKEKKQHGKNQIFVRITIPFRVLSVTSNSPLCRCGFAPRLLCNGLQGCNFFANSIMLLDIQTLKNKSLLVWNGFSQCIVTISLSYSRLAGCPKLTFYLFFNTVWRRKKNCTLSFVDVTKIAK